MPELTPQPGDVRMPEPEIGRRSAFHLPGIPMASIGLVLLVAGVVGMALQPVVNTSSLYH